MGRREGSNPKRAPRQGVPSKAGASGFRVEVGAPSPRWRLASLNQIPSLTAGFVGSL